MGRYQIHSGCFVQQQVVQAYDSFLLIVGFWSMRSFIPQELRRDAFALAGERYAELEPSLARLNALEEEQRELEAREAEKRREKKASGPRSSRR
ncbi:unnamed protein product [Ectocarpus fasciculatus]